MEHSLSIDRTSAAAGAAAAGAATGNNNDVASASKQAWRPRSRVLVSAGNFFFKYRDFLAPAVFVALVVIFPPRLPLGSERLEWTTDAIGILFCLAGLVLRGAVVGYEYIKRGGKDKKVYADTLVTGGFFAHSRNPLYLGNFLGIVGFFIVQGNLWACLIGISFYTFLYLSIVAAEETFLHGKFGSEYEDYCRRVNRFIPSFRGLHDSVGGMAFDWRRVIRKEYGTIFLWHTVVLGLIAWSEIYNARRAGLEPSHTQLNVLLALWGVGAIAWGASRVLKKKGTLGVG